MDLVSETIATVLYSYKGSIYPMDASFWSSSQRTCQSDHF